MQPYKNSFRHVLKATSLFGGVQVFNILISIIRSKFIALFIGPTGMGIASLFNTTINVVDAVTNLGLNRSAVKDISYAKENYEASKVARTVHVLKRLVWFTAVIGAVLMMITSPWLSEIAFESKEYTVSFIWLAIALLFKQFTHSNLAILQGLQKLGNLAKANLVGNSVGLLITVPLYYFFRIDAIVPAIIIASLISFAITVYYTNKTEVEKVKLTNKEAFSEGKEMINLGVTLSVSSVITLIAAYIIQIYISNEGGVDAVGYYNAGMVILNTYVGLVFNAMSTDYFPRLSAVSNTIEKIKNVVFEQAYVAVLLIVPIIVIFIAFAPFFITLLYSEAFTPTVAFVSWGILGMLFKAVSFSLGYIIIAKGDSRVFIKTAIGFNTALVVMNIIGYTYWGLQGLGVSYFIYFIIHLIVVWLITYYRYKFTFKKEFYYIFIVSTILCFSSFLLSEIEDTVVKYVSLSIMIVISSIFSIYYIDKKIGIRDVIQNFFRRKK
ncbi:O-antigen translocase [Marixanthomonas sp. SCSIO 43207]|uniref:O-antigen translocase n=1 Tax=Marixanthomonas sp. SCSIO 43207 TaxID=2779360 RepID=UPI001CA9D865|nr:O-antigen translocase [Marixanthomonas sp. SCSIO 43207]UAB80114.1 O-antigen translocase [Marixanthomonas sp. SCSIO 43207]